MDVKSMIKLNKRLKKKTAAVYCRILKKNHMDILKQLSKESALGVDQIANTILLMDEGATVPFIARYRKENTGNLDETQIRNIFHRMTYFRELEDRRKTILETIKTQGKLTAELETKLNIITNKTELEDLYLPYKPKRATRASKARDAGLEPLALWLLSLSDAEANIAAHAATYINEEKGFVTSEKTLSGACDILAEDLANDSDIRKWLRELAIDKGSFTSKVRKSFEDSKTKFQMYYDYHEQVKTIPSHRMLGLFRGEREKILRLSLDIPEETALEHLESHLVKYPQSAAAELLKQTAADSYMRLLLPATETEVRKDMKIRADEEAIRVFGENLKELFLAPPAGQKSVLGIDPGFRTGSKIAALDKTGKFLEYKTIFPHEPHKEKDKAKRIVLEMIHRYHIALIAIGNGTASRETEIFIRKIMEELPSESRPTSLIVSESGASIYSASETAIKEFPELDVTIRGAISIGRRLQDPLSELVKIDPKSIGVGQYQHDVDQKKLKISLDEGVESCVNSVGVDLNLASEELLKYVSGLNRTLARNIVKHRNNSGTFVSRKDLKKVEGIGSKTFEQSAGFLRIPNGKNLLDNSAVHPERYALVENMAKTLNTTLEKLIGNVSVLQAVDKHRFISNDVGLPTIEDILSELEKPGRDPRRSFQYATFSEDIQDIADLESGMVLEGVVTNVTNFGAFVDIGVHQDGLVHISEMADRFVRDPNEEAKVGQIVKVKVLSVDQDLKRIALSMRLTT
ncbi:MAG: Tex family protein [Candidatus Aminicenantaceae bacterium]